MADSFLLSPAFLISAAITLGAGGYSYIYLPFQMRKAYRQSLMALARAVEIKDSGAEGHGERVAKLVVAVAREMRLPRKDRQKLEYAAFLQDVGNVRVPHAMLNKTTRLTQKEFNIVKMHTVIGAEIIEQIKFLQDIAPTVRYHHEMWDGSGYPDGLSGEDIPLTARILTVCTSYDSMIHARAYRQQMDEESAIREIRAEAGTKHDPVVVDAFLKALKKHHRMEGKQIDS